eukprot:gnl/TRDRNA2_/TRDRNA2_177498_c0_seq3.p1 gnl/TRDRNA2_/TRDRNA2_177498_c0~~gnl/TRDRNA2_/TRDRNA2_177498_c0_seq3.p1  ORF type:complete len:469 (+),score=42.22 gnl/TRDRNA2_/TRDRNA2_177498_c0_seq3:171-1409(+)
MSAGEGSLPRFSNASEAAAFYKQQIARMQAIQALGPVNSTYYFIPQYVQAYQKEAKWVEGLFKKGLGHTIPRTRFLDVTMYDPGHGLNNVRVMYSLALTYGKFTNRVVLFPDQLMAYCHKLADIAKVKKDPASMWIPVEEIWDLNRTTRESHELYRALPAHRAPSSLLALARTAAMPPSIWGTPHRAWKTWTDVDAIRHFQLYEGVLLTVPYFFCDKASGRPGVDFERMQASAALRWSRHVESLIETVVTTVKERAAGKIPACVHLRLESIYEIAGMGGGRELAARLSKAMDRVQTAGWLHPYKNVLYVATGHLGLKLRKMIATQYGYSIFTKDDVLPSNWQDQRWASFLPYVATAVDFGTCASFPIHVGDHGSSFDKFIAAERTTNMVGLLTVGYDSKPLCPNACQCSWYC